MSKCYIGVSNKARNIKNIYIGVGGKARRVIKAYIGVGGKARIFWARGSIRKWGTATPLSKPRSELGAAHVGNYALFAAGMPTIGESDFKSVETYNAFLTKGTAPDFTGSNASGRAVGSQNSSYALFLASDETTYSYNKSLTVTKRASAKADPDGRAVAVSFNNYILFAGGYTAGTGISIFDSSLVYTHSSGHSNIMLDTAATTVGNYAIFGGGRSSRMDGNYYSTVEIYNTSFTKSIGTNLSVARFDFAAATNGSYAIFAGGFDENIKTVGIADVYNTSLTKSIGTNLSVSRASLTGISIDNYALFVGGRTTSQNYTNTVDIYDSTLTKTISTISSNRAYGAGTVIGNKAIFAGGSSRDSGKLAASDIVDVFVT